MRVSSWNTEVRLSRFAAHNHRGSPEQIVRNIQKLDSDIIFLPEAYDGERPVESEVISRLEDELGYKMFTVKYRDSGSRHFAAAADPYMALLTRVAVRQVGEKRLGDIRNMLVADVEDPVSRQTIRVLGVHLDDRNEANRKRQVSDLLPLINESPYQVIAMGDFNAMPASSLSARFLRNRAVHAAINHIPDPRIKDILSRLSEMAIGETIRKIESETELLSADSKRRLTMTPKMRGQEWMPSIRLAQIDHMFVSPDIGVKSFEVSRDGGSDHRAISAIIKL